MADDKKPKVFRNSCASCRQETTVADAQGKEMVLKGFLEAQMATQTAQRNKVLLQCNTASVARMATKISLKMVKPCKSGIRNFAIFL